MENTTKANAFNLTKTRVIQEVVLILFTWAVSHGIVAGGVFSGAVAVIAYMTYKKPVNVYLVVPAIAGVASHIGKGYDPWGDIIAVAVCAVFLATVRKIKLSLWQSAVIAAAITVICIGMSRLATGTLYKISLQQLVLYGLLVFVFMYVFDAMYFILSERGGKERSYVKELYPAALIAVLIMVFNGAGLSFAVWSVIIFMALLFLVYADAGIAIIVSGIGAACASLIGQQQWGLMATMIIGIIAAAFVKQLGNVISTAVFVVACWALGSVESGVILGIDNYCLFIAASVFTVTNWKFGKKLKKFVLIFTGAEDSVIVKNDNRAIALLKTKAEDMQDLAELYSTYLDSRSVLANQFDITKQIMDGIRQSLNARAKTVRTPAYDKFDVDIAVSQCAASGAINGDCCGWQDIGDGKVAMVVSDGMGKGKKAAAESLMVTKTIISLLKSGVTTDRTLKMINTVMLMKDDEDSYATVDLAIIDRRTGKAKFYKIGAAPTLIRRKDNVEEVQLSAVPLGIVNGLKIRYMETPLRKDDWVIMMSDGVSDGGLAAGNRNDMFLSLLKETASKVRSSDPKVMSELILNQAADSYIGKERDDLTVLTARII